MDALDTTEIVRNWPLFRDGEIFRFLTRYLLMQIALLLASLENAKTMDEVLKIQGVLLAQRKLLILLRSTDVSEFIKQINARQ